MWELNAPVDAMLIATKRIAPMVALDITGMLLSVNLMSFQSIVQYADGTVVQQKMS